MNSQAVRGIIRPFQPKRNCIGQNANKGMTRLADTFTNKYDCTHIGWGGNVEKHPLPSVCACVMLHTKEAAAGTQPSEHAIRQLLVLQKIDQQLALIDKKWDYKY